ncbi:nuclear transport factor 2 family protein [Rhizobium sp. S152]|uniref:nuclear transport factor 2 family protein n=1 Tax=Rhizobium sp. S152 TaxID=3055038 RepID=UPI0025A94A71|nr:nuclear transport factor 2 family protein [Rhizobium sp. S152]MDM9628341.1 nuclear transport factor 2 family protein [Rhizobium sp. S152]
MRIAISTAAAFALALSFGVTLVGLGDVMAADETANKATVREAFDAWAAGTGSPYDLLADDVEWTITGNSAAARTYPDRAAFIGEVIRPFNARMSVGLKPKIRSIHAEGDTVIVFFDAAGTARDGKPYENTYAWFLDLKDGRIVKASAFFDSIAFDELWKIPVAAD